ncbi:MAG: hypothetical protein FJY85_02590 [Deltaproteobacteria bacterium]|nr:hypothetical protein [Deltaproteobacteria bacterium]
MLARGTMRITCAFLVLVALLTAAGSAGAWDSKYRYPIKVRVSGIDSPGAHPGGVRVSAGNCPEDWSVPAGTARNQILCPKRGYSFSAGMRPFFTNLSGSVKVMSRGGEGSFLNLTGHLRLPAETTSWEFYSTLKLWDKIGLNLRYVPWFWGGPGHAGTDGNFAGLLFSANDPIQSDLNITQVMIGGEYEVSFGRELVFGPNADLHIIKWRQRVGKDLAEAADYSQTILQPALGGHVRYDPSNTGYFSWFKPYLEARISWMSFYGLGLSTWDMGAGVAPPVSRNVDAGFKFGYKQWKIDGNRGRLYTDVAVEGPYLDLDLRF